MDAACRLALEDGAASITVAAVAARAGLSRSSVYEYFASSADLVADLVVEELNHYGARLSEACAGIEDPWECIAAWIQAGLEYVVDGRHLLVKSLNAALPYGFGKEDIATGHRKLLAPLRDALATTGIEDVKSAAVYLQAITDAASVRIEAGNEAEPEIKRAIDFAIAGL